MANPNAEIEYQIRPVTRYVITRFQRGRADGPRVTSGSATRGEYDNPEVAYEVAYALCRADHDRLGYPPTDERIQYPRHPNEPTVENIERAAGEIAAACAGVPVAHPTL